MSAIAFPDIVVHSDMAERTRPLLLMLPIARNELVPMIGEHIEECTDSYNASRIIDNKIYVFNPFAQEKGALSFSIDDWFQKAVGTGNLEALGNSLRYIQEELFLVDVEKELLKSVAHSVTSTNNAILSNWAQFNRITTIDFFSMNLRNTLDAFLGLWEKYNNLVQPICLVDLTKNMQRFYGARVFFDNESMTQFSADLIKIEWIMQIEHLIDNAFKYRVPGQDIPEVNLRFDYNSELDEIAIKVLDKGRGIPSDELPNIFQNGHRAGDNHGVSGSGYGLYELAGVAQHYGAYLEVASTTDRMNYAKYVVAEGMRPDRSGGQSDDGSDDDDFIKQLGQYNTMFRIKLPRTAFFV